MTVEEQLLEGMGELKQLAREMLRRQDVTNGRVTRLEEWRQIIEREEARHDGFATARSQTAITRAQLRTLWFLFTGTAGLAAAIGGIVARYLV